MPIGVLRPIAAGAAPSVFPVGKVLRKTVVRGVQGLSVVVAPLIAEPPFSITTCGTVADELYTALLPLAYADAQNADALWKFCCAIGGFLQDIEDMARDDGVVPGWAKIMQAETAPVQSLDWLGQLMGVQPIGGLSVEQRRERIVNRAGFGRGSQSAMIAAAQLYLTGTKTVNLSERDTSAYHMSVSTYTSETPDSVMVLEALISQKPAGIQLTYSTVPGQTYSQLLANHATYTLVNSFYTDYNEVVNDLP